MPSTNTHLFALFLDQGRELLPTARTPNECVVGPEDPSRGWGADDGAPANDERSGRKRPRPESSDDGPPASSSSVAAAAEEEVVVEEEARGAPLLRSTLPGAVAAFLSSGCVALRRPVLPADFVAECLSVATSDLDFLESELVARRREALESGSAHLLAAAARGDFRELVDRDGGRRDVRYRLDRWPWTAPGLVYNGVVFPLVKELLGGGDVQLLYMGVMWAKGREKGKTTAETAEDGSDQKWHADGGHLFSHVHLPPHCVNVFYPLVDLTARNGPTEFRPGTHALGESDDPSSSAEFPLTCPAGGAILFDYRVKHRGLANATDEARPVLYLAYARTHFRDAGNARSGRSLVRGKGEGSAAAAPSSPWVARVLDGEAVRPMSGFEREECAEKEEKEGAAELRRGRKEEEDAAASSQLGSGERWVMFQMNVEVGEREGGVPLTVYHGDVPSEVAAQFCRAQGIAGDFVPALAAAIQQQMDACVA